MLASLLFSKWFSEKLLSVSSWIYYRRHFPLTDPEFLMSFSASQLMQARAAPLSSSSFVIVDELKY